MSEIYKYEFDVTTEALGLLWNVQFMNSGITSVHGIIGPIISGKNYFIRDVLKAQEWESCCITLDLKSSRITDLDSAIDRLNAILDGDCGEDKLLLIKHGDLKPYLVKGIIDRILEDSRYRFRLVLYTCLYVVDEKYSYTHITHLGDDEIILMFGRFTNLLKEYDVKLSDLTEARCDIDYRSTGLIQAMSNHLRDLGIRSKSELVDALTHWRTRLWYDYDPSDVKLYETYRDILEHDSEVKTIAKDKGIEKKDVVEMCMDILVLLALNGSTTSVRKPVLDLLVGGDSEPYVTRMRQLSMLTVDHNRDPFLRFNCDMPQYIKALFKRYLWDNPEVDYRHSASVYAAYSSLFLIKPQVRLRIVRENGSALVGFLNHLRHRRFSVGNDSYCGSFQKLSEAVKGKCALRELSPKASAKYLLMYFFSRLDGAMLGFDTNAIIEWSIPTASVKDEWKGAGGCVNGLVDVGTRETVPEWKMKDNLLVPVFGNVPKFTSGWFKTELDGFETRLKAWNLQNNHGADKEIILDDDLELERLRMSVDGYFKLVKEYNLKKEPDKKPVNVSDCVKHLFYITSNLMNRTMPQSDNKIVKLMYGFYTPKVTDVSDIYEYGDNFDVLEGCLRMLFELDVVDIQTDYSVRPVIDCIKNLITEYTEHNSGVIALQDSDNGWWDTSALILSHIVEHSVDGSLGDVTDVKQALNKLLSLCEVPGEKSLKPFDNGSRNMIYFETRLAVCRLDRVDSHVTAFAKAGDRTKVTSELERVKTDFKNTLLNDEVYACVGESFIETHPFFVVAPVSMAPADAKLTILHFEYTYNRLKGEIEIDTHVESKNPFEECERCYRRYRNYQDFKKDRPYEENETERKARRDERIIELAFLRARYMYPNRENNSKVEELCINARGWMENLVANNGVNGGLLNNEIYIDVQILFANLCLRLRRFIDVRSVLDQINDPRCRRTMHRMQIVRANEINAKYLEMTYNNTVGAKDISLLERARTHYLEAEKLSIDSSRAWVHMKMKSEVYRMDVLLNNTSDLFNRSEMLLTYLDTDFAYEHRNTYRKIVENLLSVRWSNE